MADMQAIIAKGQDRYGDQFDPSTLIATAQFAPYLHSGQRIKVQGPWETRTGTVGITTGWRPAFLLMHRSNAMGSSDVLSIQDKIVGVQVGRTYVKDGR